jgi:biopolymer transport protein ExbD
MAIKRQTRGASEINMGPFADIAFLLIIFFILATSLIRPMGRLVSMPTAAEAKEKEKSENLTIDVRQQELLFGRDEKNLEPVDIDQLRQNLMALDLPQQPDKERMVVVNLADGVKFERFYQVIAAISRAGGVVTLIEEEGGEASP